MSDGLTIRDAACATCGGVVGGGSYYSLTLEGEIDKWTCRACMEALREQRFIEEVIDRLTRNPALAAKVREALGVE